MSSAAELKNMGYESPFLEKGFFYWVKWVEDASETLFLLRKPVTLNVTNFLNSTKREPGDAVFSNHFLGHRMNFYQLDPIVCVTQVRFKRV